MNRKLKKLASAFVMVGVIGATVASVASAQTGEFTAAESFTLTGNDHVAGLEFLFTKDDEAGVNCKVTDYKGEKYTTDGAQTLINSGDSQVTFTSTYDNCVFAGVFPTTVTMNECDFDYFLGLTKPGSADTYNVTSGITCDEGDSLEIHIYLSHEAHTAGQAFCTITIDSQSGLSGATLTDEAEGHLTLGGAIEGITQTKEGACGHKHSDTGVLQLGATLEGLNGSNKSIPVNISHQ